MKVLSRKVATISCVDSIPDEGFKTALKRQLREPLLKAFDIYKSNVYYGIIVETDEEHASVLAWYKSLRDLQTSALSEVPNTIKKYL